VVSGQRPFTNLNYTGYQPGSIRAYRGPLMTPEWRQNGPGEIREPSSNSAPRTQDPALQTKDASPSIVPRALAAPQETAETARRPNNFPAGIKPQVATPAERSQAVANINQKFQQAENKLSNQPWARPDRRNRLEQSRAFFIGLIDFGYPFSLLDTWCDDLLDDQVDVGMPVDLIDSYWGLPVSTQDYVEYYNPYEVCTYQTPDGNYRQVTFQNGVVAQVM
jgi:hypothetical protein